MTMSRVLCWLFLSLTLSTVHAAHSRRRVVIRREVEPRYDRSITTFSSDGRLLQVEYGLEASRRGDPVVAMNFEDTVCIAVKSSDKVHRIDSHIIMVTSGLVGDGRVLASSLRTACQRFRLATGEAPTLTEASRMAADLQHSLTRTPGARPLGCTAILAGCNGIFQTDPGGIMEECRYCAAGKGQEKALSSLEDLSKGIDSEKKDVHVSRIAQGVANVAFEILDDKEAHIDVWILERDDNRRGGISIKCVQGLKKGDLTLVKELVSNPDDSGGQSS